MFSQIMQSVYFWQWLYISFIFENKKITLSPAIAAGSALPIESINNAPCSSPKAQDTYLQPSHSHQK